MGGTVGSWLSRAGHHVTLCARTPLARLRLVHPLGEISWEPEVVTSAEAMPTVGWAIVAVKTYQCGEARAWVEAAGKCGASVAVLQNGVEHLTRFAGVDVPAIVPAIVDIPAERNAPGELLQRRLGSIIVPDDRAGREFAALFSGTAISVSTTRDFLTAGWRKLAINCAGVVNALTLKPAGIANDPAIAEVMRALVGECVVVGRAVGALLPDDLPEEVVAGYRAADPDPVNSLHADRLAGRALESDARNGVIVRLGERYGIPTPANRMALALLNAAAARA